MIDRSKRFVSSFRNHDVELLERGDDLGVAVPVSGLCERRWVGRKFVHSINKTFPIRFGFLGQGSPCFDIDGDRLRRCDAE